MARRDCARTAVFMVLVLGGPLVTAPAAHACSLAAPRFTMEATMTARSDGLVTYRVESLRPDLGGTDTATPPRASSVTVSYRDDDERFLSVGNEYLLTVWGTGINDLSSGVTVHVDGSAIDTARRIFGVRVWIAYPLIAVGLALLTFATIVTTLRIVTNRRDAALASSSPLHR